MTHPRKRNFPSRRLIIMAVLLALLVVLLAAWRLASGPANPSTGNAFSSRAARMGSARVSAAQGFQQATPTPALTEEDIKAAPTYTTGIIILCSLVVVIIIVSTYNVTRRRSRELK